MRHSSNRRLVVAFIAVASALVPAMALADGSDDALIHSGLELRRGHHDVEALALFQRAYALRPTPRVRAQIALAEQSLGQWVAAESDLRGALDTDDPWIAHNRGALEQALSFVSTQLGWLVVSSNVPASLMLDGTKMGTLPMDRPARVAAGTVLLRVEAVGYVPVERPVRIEGNERAQELVVLVAKAESGAPSSTPEVLPARSPPRAPPAPLNLTARPVPWAAVSLAALGMAGVAVGSVFGVEALIDKAARNEHCNAGRCDSRGLSFDANARQAAMASTITFGVGAAALLAGTWLFVRAATPPRRVDVLPAATSHSAGVSAIAVW